MIFEEIVTRRIQQDYKQCKQIMKLQKQLKQCNYVLKNKTVTNKTLITVWNNDKHVQNILSHIHISQPKCLHSKFINYGKGLYQELHNKLHIIAQDGLQFMNVATVLKYYSKLQISKTNLDQFQTYLYNNSLSQSITYLNKHAKLCKTLHLNTKTSFIKLVRDRVNKFKKQYQKALVNGNNNQIKDTKQRLTNVQKQCTQAHKLPQNLLSKNRLIIHNKVTLMNIIKAQKEHIWGLEVAQYNGIKQIKSKLKTYFQPRHHIQYQANKNISLAFWTQLEQQFKTKYKFLINNDTVISKNSHHKISFNGVLMKHPNLINNTIPMNCLYWCFGMKKSLIKYLCRRGLIRGIEATKKNPARVEFIHRNMNSKEEDASDNKYTDSIKRDIALEHNQARKIMGAQNNKVTGVTYLDVKKTSYGVYFPDIKKMLYDDKHNIDNSGFHFKLGTGRHQLVVFDSPISAMSYVQLYRDKASALRDTTFLALNDKQYTSSYLHKLNQTMHFHKIVLARENDKKSYHAIQAIASQYGERLHFVRDVNHKPRISTALPVSSFHNHSAWYLLNHKQFNRTWNQELRAQERNRKDMERPGFQLNLDQYGLMTTQQLVHSLPKAMAQVFDAIAHLIGKIDIHQEDINKRNIHVVEIKQLLTKFTKPAWEKVKSYLNYSGKFLPGIDVARYTRSAYHDFYNVARSAGQLNPLLTTQNMQKILHKTQPTKLQIKQRVRKLYTLAMIAMINQEHEYQPTSPQLAQIQKTRNHMNHLIEVCSLKDIQEQAPLEYRQYIKKTPDLLKVQQHEKISKHNQMKDLHATQTVYSQNTQLLYLTDFLADKNLKQYHKLTRQLRKEEKVWQREKRHEELKRNKKHQIKSKIATLMSRVPKKDMTTFSKIIYSRGLMQRVSSPQLQKKYRAQITKESAKLSKESKAVMQDVVMANRSPKYLEHVLQQAQKFAKEMHPNALAHSHNASRRLTGGMKSSVYHIKHTKPKQHKNSSLAKSFNIPKEQHHSQKWLAMYRMHHQGFSR